VLQRLRGDIFLKRDPANRGLIEEAFRGAIAIAKQQGARSYELLASLSLAKLYQATGRPVEAHSVLAPATLEGFAPTPEMPEIAEAQALLAALAQTDEVKTDAQRRQRRQSLQVGMANALLQGRGILRRKHRSRSNGRASSSPAWRILSSGSRFSTGLGQASWCAAMRGGCWRLRP
jgi:hypothetical protein